MKNILRILNRTNVVLIFLFMILGIVSLSFSFYSQLFPKDQSKVENSERVQILRPSDLNKLENKAHVAKYPEEVGDYYAFSILAKNRISNFEYELRQDQYGIAPPPRYDPNMYEDHEVNILFVSKNTNEKNLLFKSNVYLLSRQFVNEDKEKKNLLSRNVFLVIESDTNKDGFFDGQDLKNLYFSKVGGQDLVLGAKDISSYDQVEDDMLLLSRNGTTGVRYSLMSVTDGNEREILDTADIIYGNN